MCPARSQAHHQSVKIGISNASQKRTNRAALRELSMSRHARQNHRLVGDDTDSLPFKADKTSDDVLREIFLNFVKITLVRKLQDQFLHVIRRVGVVRHQGVQRRLNPARLIKEGTNGRLFAVVQWQEDQSRRRTSANASTSFSNAASATDDFLVCVLAPTQFLGCDNLVCDGFHHVRASHEHVRAVFDHKDEVGHRRRVDRATRAWPHDHRDLRHDARGHDVALETSPVAGQGIHTFLDTRTA